MELVHHSAEAYAKQFTSPLDVMLQKLEHDTIKDHQHAHMLSGHVQGKLLEMISTMIKPERILEIGTFTGFSALCLAKGLQPSGHLHTIEIREEDAATAKEYFKIANVNTITVHTGDARTIIPQLHEAWDLVFIDADKTGYIEYYELTLPLVKKGCFILVDNVLFHGEVLQADVKGKNAKAVHAFNQHVANDNRVQQVLLTIRDGLLLLQKL